MTWFAIAVLVATSWISQLDAVGDLLSGRRLVGLGEFLRNEVLPAPLRAEPVNWPGFGEWTSSFWSELGWPSIASTVPIATYAIFLAALLALPAAFLASRPLDGRERAPGLGALSALTRGLCIVARAIPEYVLAFCLLSLLGVGAWPAVLALAIHNAGILGRLGAEAVEDVDTRAPRALRSTGATPLQVHFVGTLPAALGRFLLYFFYRLEMALRESTVLGLLGIVSLGYFVGEARAHQRLDQVVALMGVAMALILLADLVSNRARRWLESAGKR